MSTIDREFTPEHDIDSSAHEAELERVRDEEHQRADAKLKAEMAKVISSNKRLVAQMKAVVAKLNVPDAKAAVAPAVSKQDGVVVTDAATGGKALAAKEAKVADVLDAAGKADDKASGTSSGPAKEAKLGKTAAFCAMLTVAGPYMAQVFQLIRDAMQGKDVTQALGSLADASLIMGLVKQWQSESDAQYWSDFASFYQAHTAVVGSLSGATAPEPTSADLLLILHYTSVLNPTPVTDGFSWDSAQQKVDAVEALSKTYAATAAGKVSFIQGLANIQVGGMPVPRGVQAQLGELAVADAIA